MKTNILVSILFLFSSYGIFAQNIQLEPKIKTFPKEGGGASVVVTALGEWSATSSDDWIDIKIGASGVGNGKIVYTVNRNTNASDREGEIQVGDEVHRVVQRGQEAQVSPSSKVFDHSGGNGSVSVTLNAGVQWTAVSQEEWLHVTSTPSGISSGSFNYTVDPNFGVEARIGSIIVGGVTFNVTQTGRDVALTPNSFEKEQGSDIVIFTVSSLDTTSWSVLPLDGWINVIDEGPKFGDGNVTISISSNPSFLLREGRVKVNDAELVIRQKGIDKPSYSISPKNVDAPSNGSFGLVAVSATSDAPWVAQSKDSWITITENQKGAGNGNIKYVVSANPLPESRTGSIFVIPNANRVEDDYSRGLLLHMVDYGGYQFDAAGYQVASKSNAMSKDNSYFFDNAHKITWEDASSGSENLFNLPTEESFTITGMFYPYYSSPHINHLLEVQGSQFNMCLVSNESGFLQLIVDGKSYITDYKVLSNIWQLFIIRYNNTSINIYASKAEVNNIISEFPYERYKLIDGVFDPTSKWDNVKLDAYMKGGHLATITSNEEEKIIFDLLRKEANSRFYLIGLETYKVFTHPAWNYHLEWKWITKEPLTWARNRDGIGAGPNPNTERDRVAIDRDNLYDDSRAYYHTKGKIITKYHKMGYILEFPEIKFPTKTVIEKGFSSVEEPIKVLSITVDAGLVKRLDAGLNKIILGSTNFPEWGYYTGHVEDFRFYGRALLNSEIKRFSKSVESVQQPYWIGPDNETYSLLSDFKKSKAYSAETEPGHFPRPTTFPKAHFLNNLIHYEWPKWIDGHQTGVGPNDYLIGDVQVINNGAVKWTQVYGKRLINWIIAKRVPLIGPEVAAYGDRTWMFADPSLGVTDFLGNHRVFENGAFSIKVSGGNAKNTELVNGLIQKHYYSGSNSYILGINGAKIGVKKQTIKNVLPDIGLNSHPYGSLNFSHENSSILHEAINSYANNWHGSDGSSHNNHTVSTVSFWLKLNQYVPGRILSTHRITISRMDAGVYFVLDLVNENELTLAFLAGKGAGLSVHNINLTLPLNEWMQISVTEEVLLGPEVEYKFYLNGQLFSHKAHKILGGFFLDNLYDVRDLYFGNSGFKNDFYQGYGVELNPPSAKMNIAQLAIYNRILTASELKNLYLANTRQELVHQIHQGASIAKLTKSEVRMPPSGGSDFVDVEISSNTNWKAESTQTWIKVLNGKNRSGSGRLNFTVDANDSTDERSGYLNIAGNALNVIQEGYGASIESANSKFGPDGGVLRLKVQTEAGANWKAESDADWVNIVEPAGGIGNGPGTVFFIVDSYNSPVQQRRAILNIAGINHLVTQSGYELSVEPMVAEVDGNSGVLVLTVTAPLGAVWEAITNTPWITIIGDQERNGNGRIDYVITRNDTGEVRTGTIIVGGEEVKIIQKASSDAETIPHPAEREPADFKLTIGEITAYGGAWKKGLDWKAGPTPLISYVTRAGMLWRRGEDYDYDPNITPPMCWIVATSDGGNGRAIIKNSIQEVPNQIKLPGSFDKGIVNLELKWQDNIYSQAIEVVVPGNLSPKDISHGGIFNESLGIIRWGPFLDLEDKTLSFSNENQHNESSIFKIIYSVDGMERQFALFPNHKPINIPKDSLKLVYRPNNQLILFGEPGSVIMIQSSNHLDDEWREIKKIRLSEWHEKLELPFESTGTQFYRALIID